MVGALVCPGCGPSAGHNVPVDLNELWDFDRPAVSEERFRAALTSADGEDALVLRTRLHDIERYEEALAYFERALAFREQQGDPELIRVGRWTVARGLRSLGRHEEAMAIQEDLASTGEEDGYVSEELGELLLVLGRPDEAAPRFRRAYELLSKDAWLVDAEPDRLRRLAELGGVR